MKVCRICGIEKAEEDFYAGQGRTCKQCVKDRGNEWRKNNPLRYRATRKAWEKDNAELARNRRVNRLKRRYKISKMKLRAMLEAQQYRCLICQVALQDPTLIMPDSHTATKAVVDHDHRDGHVRGILCSACNVGLGLFEDDLEIIKAAYRYLRNDQANSAL